MRKNERRGFNIIQLNKAASLAGDSKLPGFSGPLADFMRNLHKAVDRATSIYAQLSAYQDATAGQLDRAFNDLSEYSAILDRNADKALSLIGNGSSSTLGSWARSVTKGRSLNFGISSDGAYLIWSRIYFGDDDKFFQKLASSALFTDLAIETVHAPRTGCGDYYSIELRCKEGQDVACAKDKDGNPDSGFLFLEVASQADVDAAVSELIRRGVGRTNDHNYKHEWRSFVASLWTRFNPNSQYASASWSDPQRCEPSTNRGNVGVVQRFPV